MRISHHFKATLVFSSFTLFLKCCRLSKLIPIPWQTWEFTILRAQNAENNGPLFSLGLMLLLRLKGNNFTISYACSPWHSSAPRRAQRLVENNVTGQRPLISRTAVLYPFTNQQLHIPNSIIQRGGLGGGEEEELLFKYLKIFNPQNETLNSRYCLTSNVSDTCWDNSEMHTMYVQSFSLHFYTELADL